MFKKSNYLGSKSEQYQQVIAQLKSLISGETNSIANLSNAAALLNLFLDDINWVGFYLMDSKTNELVLGPFQGLPACIRIPVGRGVCGTAAAELKTQRIADVHTFPGHIACDAASRSEVVIPILVKGQLFGVLDIDSPLKNRFDREDEMGLENFCKMLTLGL